MALFFHVDMDAFFAAIEQRDHPLWSNRALIVGAMPGCRGVVSACSYQARAFGVHSGQNIADAYQCCPRAIYVLPNMARYIEVSQKIMVTLSLFSDEVESLSLDEAWLNLSNHTLAQADPLAYAQRIKASISQAVGLTISVGIGSNRLLAKLASEHQKPDGLFWLKDAECYSFLEELPLNKLWGIGKKSRQELALRGITTVQALQACTLLDLQHHFGPKSGLILYHRCRGVDARDHNATIKNRSVSNEITLEEDSCDEAYILQQLLALSHRSFSRMRASSVESRTVSVKIRLKNFETMQIQKNLGSNIISAEQLYSEAKNLFYQKWAKGSWLRLIGISLCNVESYRQLTLFSEQDEKRRSLEKLMMQFKQKGFFVTKATLLEDEKQKRRQKEKGRLIFDGEKQILHS